MRIVLALIAALLLTGCNSQPQPIVFEVRTQRLNPEYLKAQQEIDATMIKLLHALSQQNK